jgi:hypothetical protein
MNDSKTTLADEFGLCMAVLSAVGLAFALFAYRHGGDLLTTVLMPNHVARALRVASIGGSALGLLVACGLMCEVRRGQRWLTAYITVALAVKLATWSLVGVIGGPKAMWQPYHDGLLLAAGASLLWPLVLLTWLRWLQRQFNEFPTAFARIAR